MKKIFILSALAIAAIGCTKSEVVEAPESFEAPITFETYIGRAPVTKAESVDLAYLQGENRGFHVSAFLHSAVDNSAAPTLVNTPYMDKDVFWTETGTNLTPETETTKHVFSDATDQPTAPQVSGSEWVVPSDWTDEPTNTSKWYVTYTYTDGSWNAGSVAQYDYKGLWDYDGVAYWPDSSSDKYLAFVAYGVNSKGTGDDATYTNTAISDITNYKSFKFTVNDEVANQQDLIVAPMVHHKKLDENASNTTVALDFKHVLSRIGFSLVANQDNNVGIVIKDITLTGNFATTGNVELTKTTPEIVPSTSSSTTYSLLTLPATSGESTTNYCFSSSASTEETPIFINATYTASTDSKHPQGYVTVSHLDGNVVTANNANRFMMLMPNAKNTDENATGYAPGDYTITVNYQLEDAAPLTATVPLNNWTFEPGKSYDFVMKVSTSAIGFSVTVTNWVPYFPQEGSGNETTNNGTYTLTPVISENTGA